jgi:adenine-specific DNA methylase
MTDAKKLIEVALPLDAINAASAREKSIRHGLRAHSLLRRKTPGGYWR